MSITPVESGEIWFMLWVCKSSSKRFCSLTRRGLMGGCWIERKKAIKKNCWAIELEGREGKGFGRFWTVVWPCIPPAGGQEVGWEEDGGVVGCYCQGRQYSYASLATVSPFLHLASCRAKYWEELWHVQDCLYRYSLTTQHCGCFALAVSGLQMVYSIEEAWWVTCKHHVLLYQRLEHPWLGISWDW